MSEEKNTESISSDDKRKDSVDLKLFAVLVIFIVIAVSVAFLIWGFTPEQNNNNLDGTIPYGNYNFLAQNDLYTLEYQWAGIVYDINFRYHPNNVTHIPIRGPWEDLDRDVYLSFDPYMSEKSMAYTRGSMLDLVQKLTLLFGRNVQIVCTDNSHPDCAELPVVTCDTHNSAIVFYESEQPRITLKGSCYEIHGFEEDLFKAEHKLVFVMLNIIRE